MALELSSLIAILENVFDRLESRELLDRSPCLGVASQLGKLKILLMKIKSVLVDVETQQLKKELISCLDDLLDLVYDLDDMLDEFTTDILGRELMAERYFSISKDKSSTPQCKFINADTRTMV
ncbi:uncharacterized protein LOC123198707 isoform X2 [Mangifera indica]|uniref:uncharacterized protein LOC123198707 isoform X2 n=1 Tax=Mangifera indica TaxID=29780 RepID=UPI001CFC10EE|nr:uncharacterized protein LOC123198707 isoform X2 [Mangifera indica]